MKEKIEKDIFQLLDDKLAVAAESTSADLNLKDDLGMDSLDIVEFSMEVEKKFNISIPDRVAEGFVTVQDVINCVDGLIQEPQKGFGG